MMGMTTEISSVLMFRLRSLENMGSLSLSRSESVDTVSKYHRFDGLQTNPSSLVEKSLSQTIDDLAVQSPALMEPNTKEKEDEEIDEF
ncbi:MAG: hypothetical protein K2X53_04430 [Alphaproteobacteria bacterium]|nr:hypothetical protein [Alphaproteobacteria bacterium]